MEAFGIIGMTFGIMGMGLGATAFVRLSQLEEKLKKAGVLGEDHRPIDRS